MKKPFDKKSTSGIAKKADKAQVTTPAAGTTADARPDRAPQNKNHKGKKAAVSNMPKISVRSPHTVCGETATRMGAFGADSTHGREHN